MANAWMSHLNNTRRNNPGMSLSQAMKKASKTYKKKRNQRGGQGGPGGDPKPHHPDSTRLGPHKHDDMAKKDHTHPLKGIAGGQGNNAGGNNAGGNNTGGNNADKKGGRRRRKSRRRRRSRRRQRGGQKDPLGENAESEEAPVPIHGDEAHKGAAEAEKPEGDHATPEEGGTAGEGETGPSRPTADIQGENSDENSGEGNQTGAGRRRSRRRRRNSRRRGRRRRSRRRRRNSRRGGRRRRRSRRRRR